MENSPTTTSLSECYELGVQHFILSASTCEHNNIFRITTKGIPAAQMERGAFYLYFVHFLLLPALLTDDASVLKI